MRFLIFLLRGHVGYLLAAMLIGMASGAANAWLISHVNNELAALDAGTTGPAWLYLGVTMVVFVSGAVSEVMLVFLSEKLAYNLRINLCAQIMALPIADSERLGKASLTAAFTQDIPTITIALLRIPTVCVNGTITLGCLVYLGFLSPFILAVLFAFLVIALTAYVLPERRALRHIKAYRHAWDGMLANFDVMNDGAKELKLNYERRQRFYNDALRDSAERVRHTGYVYRGVYAVVTNWSRILFFFFIAILLHALPGYDEVNLKTITGFSIVVLYLIGPLELLINSVPRFRAADVAFAKVQQLGLRLDAGSHGAPLLGPGIDPDDLHDAQPIGEITLRGVTHTYYREREERNFALGPIDLTIRAGELVFLTGGNGSGKTTLAKLLAGLYIPDKGEILLDGQPVDDGNRDRYRQHFSAIFSDFYVFHELVGGRGSDLDARARDYLQMLHLDHKVTVEGNRLSTTALSSGQRKRLALLASYLEDRPVYLFDEWASDQDPAFKKIFYHELLPELKQRGKMVIAITHDDRYFAIADRLVHLVDGQLESAPSAATAEEPGQDRKASSDHQSQT